MLSKIKKLFQRTKKLGGMKPSHVLRTEKLYRDLCYEMTYFFHQEKLNFADFQISIIEMEISKTDLKLKVWLGRPGLFIGRRGALIDRLKEYLSGYFKLNVSIRVEEFDPIITYFDPDFGGKSCFDFDDYDDSEVNYDDF